MMCKFAEWFDRYAMWTCNKFRHCSCNYNSKTWKRCPKRTDLKRRNK